MKIVINMIAIVLAFSWISVLSANNNSNKQSVESFMTCASGNGDGIKAVSLPSTINADQCPPFGDVSCADCIISLEKQGCNLINVVVDHLMNPEIGALPATTYLLSCTRP